MKKSIIVSFIILILVIGWFVSGQFFGNGNYNYKDSSIKLVDSSALGITLYSESQII